MADYTELLRLCDEQRYLPDGPKDAYDNLKKAAQDDPDGARDKLQNLQGCRKTVDRHREMLEEALAQ